jgi:hypothetical protein
VKQLVCKTVATLPTEGDFNQWKGWIPYYLVFDKASGELDSWYADLDEYNRQQQLWPQAMPPTQRVEIKGDIEVKVK